MDQTDILDTMAGEIAEAVEILRRHHPQDSEADLRRRAEGLRAKRYQTGLWSTSSIGLSPAPVEAEPLKRKRGRPKGSRNRPNPELERAASAELPNRAGRSPATRKGGSDAEDRQQWNSWRL